jgi:hypothetical protein
VRRLPHHLRRNLLSRNHSHSRNLMAMVNDHPVAVTEIGIGTAIATATGIETARGTVIGIEKGKGILTESATANRVIQNGASARPGGGAAIENATANMALAAEEVTSNRIVQTAETAIAAGRDHRSRFLAAT